MKQFKKVGSGNGKYTVDGQEKTPLHHMGKAFLGTTRASASSSTLFLLALTLMVG